MTKQLLFLMPSLRPQDTEDLSPRSDAPSRRCWKYLKGGQSPYAGGPVFLGWPVRTDCPSSTHNTLYAARRPRRTRCICPWANTLRAELMSRVTTKRQQGTQKTEAPRGRNVKVYADSAAFLSRANRQNVLPACRVKSLGGDLPDHRAADFYNVDQSESGFAARDRARSTCRSCPLQRECLLSAVEAQEPLGIWGGLTPGARMNPIKVATELREIDSHNAPMQEAS